MPLPRYVSAYADTPGHDEEASPPYHERTQLNPVIAVLAGWIRISGLRRGSAAALHAVRGRNVAASAAFRRRKAVRMFM